MLSLARLVLLKLRAGRRRFIGEMLAILIIVVIVVGIGVLLFMMLGGMMRGGGRASVTVSAFGTASPDGRSASITLILQNSGDGAARVAAVYVEPVNSPAVSPSWVTVPGMSLTVATGAPSIGSMPTAGAIEVPPRGEARINIRISPTGSGKVYPGHQYRISVVYFDVGSGEGAIADTVINLR